MSSKSEHNRIATQSLFAYHGNAQGEKPQTHEWSAYQMNFGDTVNIQSRQPFATTQVNAIDSIVITTETDVNRILAEWREFDPEITVHNSLNSVQAVRLFINWSDKNGALDLQQGDYFTFVFPDIFIQDFIDNAIDVPIRNPLGDIVATYSIYDNASSQKEVRITFTDYVDSNSDISGDFWALLFVGRVFTTETVPLEFIINGELAASGAVTINPSSTLTPRNRKYGYGDPERSVDGYYIFEWLVYLNMDENPEGGFHTLQNYSFEDVIPPNSPHVFLTDEIRQTLGIPPAAYTARIGEYTGADSVASSSRYAQFLAQYNSFGATSWYNSIEWYPLSNGLTTIGIDGSGGLDVSNVVINDKMFSANLGTVTRPTALNFYTIATLRLAESALGDKEVVALFQNTFNGNYGEPLTASLSIFRFEAGGTAQGIVGEFSFALTKVDSNYTALPGATYALFTSPDLALVDRFVVSGTDGAVTFANLPAGTYYLQETAAPYGYLPNSTIYRATLNSAGVEIYYGDTFENRLVDNIVIDQSEFEVQPVSSTLIGTKHLTGKPLGSGMFSFDVKDSGGATVANGTNDASGNILFSPIEFSAPGIYVFTVEEVKGNVSGIIYDGTIFAVTITVTDDGSGILALDIVYPIGGIVFNNSFSVNPESRTPQCFSTKCRKSIKGQKIWNDFDNQFDTRPPFIEIVLLRDGEIYKSINVDATSNWAFAFCCLPIGQNTSHRYEYQIDEVDVPFGYAKTIEGYNVINTLLQ